MNTITCNVCTDSSCSLCLAADPAALANTEMTSGGGFCASGPNAVARVRCISVLGSLRMEALGMKRRGRSALACVREDFGISARTAAKALPLFEAALRERGIIR